MAATTVDINALNRSINFQFQSLFNNRPQHWQFKTLRRQSNSFQEVYAWVAELPQMRKRIGPRIVQKLATRSFAINNDEWEMTLEIQRRDILFDRLGMYDQKIALLARSASLWYDDRVTAVQQANPTCYDGGSFYGASHPVNIDDSTAGTFQNDYSSTDLTVANFWTLAAGMMSFVGENGVPLELMPTVLEVPPQLALQGANVLQNAFTAQVIKNVAGTENVAAAQLQNKVPALVSCQLQINPRLQNQPKVWYLHSTDLLPPFILQVAEDPSDIVPLINMTDPNVFFQDRYIWGINADGGAGVGLPHTSIRATTP